MRQALAKDIDMVAEMVPFRRDGGWGGEEIREVPYVHVPNLIRKAADVIEEHRRYNIIAVRATCHSLTITLLDHQLPIHLQADMEWSHLP